MEEVKAVNGVGEGLDVSRDHDHAVSSALDSVGRSIRHHLDHDLKFRSTGRDPKGNGYAYAEVPDWALRQWLDRIEIAQNGISISGSADGEATLVTEEQVAVEGSREAIETSSSDLLTASEARVKALEGALEPFAEFARGMPTAIPDKHQMTQGSSLARQQVTAGDFRRARAALTHEVGE